MGGIAEGLPQFIDSGVYVGIVVDGGTGRPEPHAQLFAGDHLAWLLEERQENLINLPLEPEPGAISCHFLPLLINPEWAEMDIPAGGQHYVLRGCRLIRPLH